MFKKLLILSTLAVFSFGFVQAREGVDGKAVHTVFSDTTSEKKDSMGSSSLAPADPKDEFRELFPDAALSVDAGMALLNPEAVSFVEDYKEDFGKKMHEIEEKGQARLNLIEDVLTRNNLPGELKYLAIVESYLKPSARSWAGAVGVWQFMPATARNMGLKVNHKVDERRDLYKSTKAAARYLSSLYKMYGDWLLVIAAYNSGPGNVNKAIRKSGSRDFWELQGFLPTESRNHVKKFIATHYILKGEGSITTLTKSEADKLLSGTSSSDAVAATWLNTKLQPVSGRYNSLVVVKHLALDISEFNKMNPDFDKQIAVSGRYDMRLPEDKIADFLAKKPEILSESMLLLLDPEAASISKIQEPVANE